MALLNSIRSRASEGIGSLVSGNSKRLTVLIFHRVLPEADPLSPDEMYASRFDALISMLVKVFNVLPMDDALSRWKSGTLPPRALTITFDDGYADNFTVACPILLKYGVKAGFFVASGFLNGGIMWNDVAREAIRTYEGDEIDLRWLDLGIRPVATSSERFRLVEEMLLKLKYRTLESRKEALARIVEETRAISPGNLMLSTSQLRGLRDAGMEIGGHTSSHPILAVLPEPEARKQIAEDRERLAELLGQRPRYFAYPNGRPEKDYQATHVRLVRELGYEAAFTTSCGSVGPESGAFELPRFTPWDRGLTRFSLRLAHNYFRSHSPRLMADEALV